MTNKKQLLILFILLINLFLLPTDSENSFTILKIGSLLLISFLLLKPNKLLPSRTFSQPISTDINEETDDVEIDFHHQTYVKLFQQIMHFDGILFLKFDPKREKFYIADSHYQYATLKQNYTIENHHPLYEKFVRDQESVLEKNGHLSYLDYYKHIDKDRKEFYAITIKRNHQIAGAFLFDHSEHETFTDEIIEIIHALLKLFSKTINVPEDPSFDPQNLKRSQFLMDFYKTSLQHNSERDFFESLKLYIPRLFIATNFYVVKQISEKEGVLASILGSTEGIKRSETFILDEGIIGWSLKHNKFVSLDNLIQSKQYTIRFHGKESKPERIKSLMFLPISTSPAIGIGFESELENAFTNEQKSLIQSLAPDIKSVYEEVRRKEQIISENIFDSEHLAFNFNLFNELFNGLKSLYHRKEIPVQCLIVKLTQIDFGSDAKKQTIYKYVFKELRRSLRPSDYIFNYNAQTFVLLLSYTDTEKLRMVEERIKTKINTTRILIENNYIEPEIKTMAIENCYDKTLDEIKFKLHMI